MKTLREKIIDLFLTMMIFISSLITPLIAQTIPCGVDDLNPQQTEVVRNQVEQYYSLENTPLNKEIRIPVAVHIIRNDGGAGNVSDQVIESQIEVLNSCFNSTYFNFVLYSIDRINNSTWATHQMGSSAETEMKQSLSVDPKHILNLYVCLSPWLDDPDDLAGYATYPWYYVEDSFMHGVIIKYNTLPGGSHEVYNNGKVTVHEVGHYLGLYHTFKDGCPSGSKDLGDEVNDTPFEESPNLSACDETLNTCPEPGYDPIHNFMDYSPDYCRYEFTPGQSTRMNELVAVYKPSLSDQLMFVEQRKENGDLAIGSTIARWENETNFQNYVIPIPPFPMSVENQETILAEQNIIGSPTEKYYIWKSNGVNENDVINHHTFYPEALTKILTSQLHGTYNATLQCSLENSVSAATLSFKDPWYIDYADPLYNNQLRNRGMKTTGTDALIFQPVAYAVNNLGTTSAHKGVFLNQFPDVNDPTKPYYTVKSEQTPTFPINGTDRIFYFQNWSGTDVQFENASTLQTAVVFKDNIPGVDPIVSANYKGHLVSNSSTASKSNSQRKVVCDRNGIYHMVYQSMNTLWYTKSLTTNFLGEWTRDEKLIDLGVDVILTNPSIDINTDPSGPNPDDKLSIVFEASSGANDALIYTVIKNINTETVNLLGTNNPISVDPSYFGNVKPVVASFGDEVVVVYKYSATSPLNCLRYYLDGGTWTQVYPIQVIPNTDQTSVNPAIASNNRPHQTNNKVQIAWQQGATIIRYQYSEKTANMSSARNFSGYNSNVSFGSGNTYNTNPSIVDINTSGARIVWQGTKKLSPTDYQYRTVFKNPTPSSTFSNFGSNSAPPSINKIEDNTEFVFGWGLNDGTAAYFADNTLSQIYPLNIPGKDVQMCNGASKSSMFATSFITPATPPYYFAQSNDIQSLYTISKVSVTGINKGREGVVAKGSGELYFTIGDVNVNGENISFTTLPDSFTVTSVNDINDNVRTIPFAVSDNSQFYYSVQYGITDSAEVVNSLSENDIVSFRVEIVDEATNEVLGVFDNVSFTKQQAVPYENFSYQVSTEGIGNRTVYLRLVTSATEGCSFSLANLLDNQNIIAKRAINQISFKSAAVIKDYSLEQNYPNPFNPVTTITYQLPKSGSVTLKIFDILGNEVKTLVDEQKEMGRYTVQFDASSLASGMYVYQLRANDYTSTKKMMLLK